MSHNVLVIRRSREYHTLRYQVDRQHRKNAAVQVITLSRGMVTPVLYFPGELPFGKVGAEVDGGAFEFIVVQISTDCHKVLPVPWGHLTG